MNVLKYIVIFILAIVGLVTAYISGPLSSFGSVVVLNEGYFQSLQHHYYYSGFLSALFTCLAAYLFRANLIVVAAIFLGAGVLWVAFTQWGDPEFLQYLMGATIEFMVPYTVMGLAILVITLGINKKWPRLN